MIPCIKKEHVVVSRSGVRAMALQKNGEMLDDFNIVKTKNNIHVINAPSPAATACLAIGSQITELSSDHFNL